jgi:cobalt/nickel transport system permease protein
LVVLLGFSTPFTEFMGSLSWFKVPKGFIEILMFAYRYIFMLLDDASVIYNAQKNRLGFSSIRRGLSSFGVLSASLVLKAFQQSQNTTSAMIQRCYNGSMPIAAHRPFKKSEITAAILIISALGVLWRVQ